MTDVVERSEDASSPNRLNSGVLGLFDSVIMGIAGSAPAYSIGATTGALFFRCRLWRTRGAVVLRILMFGIVWAFSYLSRDDSHAGAAYSWVRRAIHPILGYLSGWPSSCPPSLHGDRHVPGRLQRATTLFQHAV